MISALIYGLPSVFVLLVAIVGNLFTAPEISTWYTTLNLPSWTPNGALIATVWTVLYILLAISIIIFLLRNRKFAQPLILGLFVVNGILNALWSYIFFSLHNIQAAFVEIWFLNLSILLLIVLLWRKDPTAGLLLIPYLMWVSFATYLNYQILLLN